MREEGLDVCAIAAHLAIVVANDSEMLQLWAAPKQFDDIIPAHPDRELDDKPLKDAGGSGYKG